MSPNDDDVWAPVRKQWFGYRDRARAVLSQGVIKVTTTEDTPEIMCLGETLLHAGICTSHPPEQAAAAYFSPGGGLRWRFMPNAPRGWFESFPDGTPETYPTPCPRSPGTHIHIMLECY